jgi:hypothetical protein
VDQVDLAEQNDVGELDLLDQQIADRTLIVGAEGLAPAGEVVGALVIAQEVQPSTTVTMVSSRARSDRLRPRRGR